MWMELGPRWLSALGAQACRWLDGQEEVAEPQREHGVALEKWVRFVGRGASRSEGTEGRCRWRKPGRGGTGHGQGMGAGSCGR